MTDDTIGIIQEHDGWKEEIESHLTNGWGFKSEFIFLDCFKDVKRFLMGPVGIVEGKTIAAVSRMVDGEQEVIDFIKENPDTILYTFQRMEIEESKEYRYILRYGVEQK